VPAWDHLRMPLNAARAPGVARIEPGLNLIPLAHLLSPMQLGTSPQECHRFAISPRRVWQYGLECSCHFPLATTCQITCSNNSAEEGFTPQEGGQTWAAFGTACYR
jgi:hypothetical protein